MANSNLLGDLELYRNQAMADLVFKNVSGGERFFAYVGPNGDTLANNEVALVSKRDSDFIGTLAKQAMSRDIANGNIKFGNKGVTFYTVDFIAGDDGAAENVVIPEAGTVVGIYAVTNAGCEGTEVVTATIGGTSIVDTAGTNDELVIASAASGKAKSMSLSGTAANLTFKGRSTLSVGISSFTGDDAATIVVAVAHHTL